MIASIITAGAISACHQIKALESNRKAFELSIANFSEEEKSLAREKRRLGMREERMHQELCQAIRDSKPATNSSIGMAGVIFGSCLTAGMINND